jgi:hypothetical protein
MRARCEEIHVGHRLVALLNVLNGQRRIGTRLDPRLCKADVSAATPRTFAGHEFEREPQSSRPRPIQHLQLMA